VKIIDILTISIEYIHRLLNYKQTANSDSKLEGRKTEQTEADKIDKCHQNFSGFCRQWLYRRNNTNYSTTKDCNNTSLTNYTKNCFAGAMFV